MERKRARLEKNGGPLKVIIQKAGEVQLITEGIWGFSIVMANLAHLV